MKFLACSHCFTSPDTTRQSHRQPIQEIANPLVVTKRSVPKVLHQRSRESTNDLNSPTRKRRFPAMLVNAFSSWPRRRRSQKRTTVPRNIRKTVHVIEPPARRKVKHHCLPTRTQRLIRMYEEKANSPEVDHFQYHQEFLIDPPASFSGDDSLESHQNFKNKLNTLDFRRMNTVGLEEPSTSTTKSEHNLYGKNSYSDKESSAASISKFARKTFLEDFLKERLRIEQTMIDLLNGRDPGSIILKKSRNEDKRVRFCVDGGEKELRVNATGENSVELKDNDKMAQETEIKLSIDPRTKVEDFYVEKRTTYLKDKTVEDKALVLKIAPQKEMKEPDVEEPIGMVKARDVVFRNFGKMSL